jgi:hypothetical protein
MPPRLSILCALALALGAAPGRAALRMVAAGLRQYNVLTATPVTALYR